MRTGENEHGLKQVMDLTRGIAIVVLIIHCYYECYGAFQAWGWVYPISDRLLNNITRMPFFSGFMKTKLIALGFLLLSLLGVKGKKNDKISLRSALGYFFTGIALFLSSGIILYYFKGNIEVIAASYIGFTGLGFILIITGGGLHSRIIKWKLNSDVFNKDNETFPQEERLLENEYSINLPAVYNLKRKQRRSWINIYSLRGFLVIGSPGSGKSYFVIENVIRQHIAKGFSMLVYDYKYDDLTRLAYNYYLKHRDKYKVRPSFHAINLDNPAYSDCCNPIHPSLLRDITDAIEAARIILLGLNRSWLRNKGSSLWKARLTF